MQSSNDEKKLQASVQQLTGLGVRRQTKTSVHAPGRPANGPLVRHQQRQRRQKSKASSFFPARAGVMWCSGRILARRVIIVIILLLSCELLLLLLFYCYQLFCMPNRTFALPVSHIKAHIYRNRLSRAILVPRFVL